MSKRVGKAYLVSYLMDNANYTRFDAETAVNLTLEAITHALRAGANVSFSNIGTLRRETAPARIRRNPQNGETLPVPATEVVRWTTSPTLADVLNDRISRDTLAVKAPKGSL